MQRIKYTIAVFILSLFIFHPVEAQDDFPYEIQLQPVEIPELPGLHSFAFGHHDGKWLIIGGRKDGMHARQPFASFPSAENNRLLFVVDVEEEMLWTSELTSLSTGIQEQFQSTNMNFNQVEDTLHIIGGYAYAQSAGDHITFPYLTTLIVSKVIDAIIHGNPIQSFIKQQSDERMAVTGGQLGNINGELYLVGGQRFDGRYNPMDHPTFTQKYTDQIAIFQVDNQGSKPVVSDYRSMDDQVNLHRRDYNLLPMIYEEGEEGYLISSGVFQQNVDLPYLYPVEIRKDKITPRTDFSQYLSHYHSARSSLYDGNLKTNHSIFFGGMSQYYYSNGQLIQDNQVPFVRTISRVSRQVDGSFHEYLMPLEMPELLGAGAEFIPNLALEAYSNEVFKMDEFSGNQMLLGHIVGGIHSPMLNPFSSNQTNQTWAEPTIYAVYLSPSQTSTQSLIDETNDLLLGIHPNPTQQKVHVEIQSTKNGSLHYFLTNKSGQIIQHGSLSDHPGGISSAVLKLDPQPSHGLYYLTVVLADKYYSTKKLLVD